MNIIPDPSLCMHQKDTDEVFQHFFIKKMWMKNTSIVVNSADMNLYNAISTSSIMAKQL